MTPQEIIIAGVLNTAQLLTKRFTQEHHGNIYPCWGLATLAKHVYWDILGQSETLLSIWKFPKKTRATPKSSSKFSWGVFPHIKHHHPMIIPGGVQPLASTAGWWARATPLKNMSSSIGMIRNPIYGKIKLMFQTTNQVFFWRKLKQQPSSHRISPS